jgi:xanthine dehydrogenase YagR molybdenum-binding subunit
MQPAASSPRSGTIIGQPLDRIEGRLKVTGRAHYAADHRVDGPLAFAAGVMSTIASGTIRDIDVAEALAAPGVITVLHHGNVPKLARCPDKMGEKLKASEERPPFEDDRVYYAGQFVALVVAETFEQARWASHLVRVTYNEEKPVLTLDAGIAENGTKNQEDEASRRGEPETAFAKADVQLDETYTTPVEVHNAMELHSTLAKWEGGKLIVYDSTQWVVGQARSLAYVLGLPPENVELHAEFIGGGFGSKLFLWPHTVLAAVAARETGRAVKLVLPRQHQFTTAGHRPTTRQRLRLGARRTGELTAILHDSLTHTSKVTEYVESCGHATPWLYRCPNVSVSGSTVAVNVGTPTSMRAPGIASGLFALEAAMDELAARLHMDPIELRRRNLPERDQEKNLPWSSNHFADCLKIAADRFGWVRRDPEPGSMRAGHEIIGWGFASATWPAHRQEAAVRVAFQPDGSVRVECATQDIGTGTYTVLAQVVSEITTLPFSHLDVAIGQNGFPAGPISGGSMATATVVPAVAEATRRLVALLFEQATRPGAPFAGLPPRSLRLEDGHLTDDRGRRLRLREVVEQLTAMGAPLSAEAHAKPGEEAKKYTFRSFGAHCVEVRWDPQVARLRVTRIVSAFDVGRVINQKTACNQIAGALVMGLGMALREQSVYDLRHGRVVTDNLADYLVPVHADIPELDITLLDRPDPLIGDYGAKGMGEIGVTGVAAAITNAAWHATGRRFRDLPVTIEKLLASE